MSSQPAKPDFRGAESLVPKIHFPDLKNPDSDAQQAACVKACRQAYQASVDSRHYLFDSLHIFYPALAAQLDALSIRGVQALHDQYVYTRQIINQPEPGSDQPSGFEGFREATRVDLKGYAQIQKAYQDLRGFILSLKELS